MCSPRAENLLDIARTNLDAGQLPPDLAARFRASLQEEPQRGGQDIGLGLCGQGLARLAQKLDQVTCADCLVLLGPPAGPAAG